MTYKQTGDKPPQDLQVEIALELRCFTSEQGYVLQINGKNYGFEPAGVELLARCVADLLLASRTPVGPTH